MYYIQMARRKIRKDGLIVMMNAGGLEHGGGVGRMIGYVADVWRTAADAPAISVVATRGPPPLGAASALRFAAALATVAALAVRGRVRVLHVHVSARGSLLRKTIVAWWGRLFRQRVMLHVHGSSFDTYFESLPGWLKVVVRTTFHRADMVVVLGTYWRDFARTALAVPESRLEIVHNGVPDPLTGQHPRTSGAARQPDAGLRILFLGQLSARKGTPELVAAFAVLAREHRGWTATLAGDGDVAATKELVARNGLDDCVSLPGWVDRKTADTLLDWADVVVLPSHQENQPLSVIEAMAYGKAIVATPVGAVPEMISDGVNGLLVTPGDVNGIAAALARLTTSPDLRLTLAKNARATFVERYDVRITAAKLARIYDKLDAIDAAPALRPTATTG